MTRLLSLAQWLTILLPICMIFGKAPTDIAASCVATLFILHSFIIKDFNWIKARWVQFGLAFWGYIILRSLFVENIEGALEHALPWGRYLMLAVALWWWIIDPRTSTRLFWALSITVSLLIADTLVQYITGTDLFFGQEKIGEDRLTGPFAKPRIGHTLTWILPPILLVWLGMAARNTQTYWQRLGGLFGVGIACFTVMVTGERSPLLLLLLAIGLAFLLAPNLRRLLLIAGGIAMLGGGVFLIQNTVLYQRHVVSTMHTIEHFWDMPYGKIYLDSQDMIAAHPLFGVGPKQYRVMTMNPKYGAREPQLHPHNLYLELWTETGLIGLALMLGLFAQWLRIFWKNWAHWQKDMLIAGAIIAVLIRLWPIISGPSFYASWNIIPFWMAAGWALGLLQRKEYM